jgi:hypothetical protein
MIKIEGSSSVIVYNGLVFTPQGSIFEIASTGATGEASYSAMTTGNGYFVNFTAAGTFTAVHNTVNTTEISGNNVSGAGIYQYADIASVTSNGIDSATTQVPFDWKPYATANVTANAVRGTAGFASTQFNVTNGFVELFSPFFAYTPVVATAPGPFTYTVLPTDSYIAVDTTAVGATVTLPVSPTIAAGRTFTIKSVAGANNITVDVTGGVFIDGAATQTIIAPNGFLQVLYNGTTYEIYGQ